MQITLLLKVQCDWEAMFTNRSSYFSGEEPQYSFHKFDALFDYFSVAWKTKKYFIQLFSVFYACK